MRSSANDLLTRSSIPLYFVAAYAIAWIPALAMPKLAGISAFAPALAAIVVSLGCEGKEKLRDLISRLFIWKVELRWYLVALLAPLVLELLAIWTQWLLGNRMPFDFKAWTSMLPGQLPWLAVFLLFLVCLSAGEELGWRGFALPRLQARFGMVPASLILGVLWGLWHLPTFWIPGSAQYGLPIPGYVLATIGYTFIYTFIYNGTRGSVLLTSLYHAASNLTLLYANAMFPSVIGNLYGSLPALALLIILVAVIGAGRGRPEKRLLVSGT